MKGEESITSNVTIDVFIGLQFCKRNAAASDSSDDIAGPQKLQRRLTRLESRIALVRSNLPAESKIIASKECGIASFFLTEVKHLPSGLAIASCATIPPRTCHTSTTGFRDAKGTYCLAPEADSKTRRVR